MVWASRPIDTPHSGSTTWRAERTAERQAAARPSRPRTPRKRHIVRNTPTRSATGIEPVTASPLSDRKSVVEGKRVSVRVDPGGRRIIKKKKHYEVESRG